jgi:ketosteroid isomerase-like protein
MSRLSRYHRTFSVVVGLAAAAPIAAAAQGVETPHLPLRTVIQELNSTRAEYAEAFNAKDADAVAAFYLPEAIWIDDGGNRTAGSKAIGDRLRKDAPTWPHMVLTSDTVRVYGATALDFGTVKTHPKDGGENVSHYLAVLRKGLKGWKLAAVATVPDTAAKSGK